MHSRSEIAARFWPDVLDESARTSLRSALSALRRSLGPAADGCLVANRETVGLTGDVRIDAEAFERACRRGPAGGGDRPLPGRPPVRARRRLGPGRARRMARARRAACSATSPRPPRRRGTGRRRSRIPGGASRSTRWARRRSGPSSAGSGRPATAPPRSRRTTATPTGSEASCGSHRRPRPGRSWRSCAAVGRARARRSCPLPSLPGPSRCSSPTSSAPPSCSDELGDDEAERLRKVHFSLLRDVAREPCGPRGEVAGRRPDGGVRQQHRRRRLRGRDPAGRRPPQPPSRERPAAGPRRPERRRADPRRGRLLRHAGRRRQAALRPRRGRSDPGLRPRADADRRSRRLHLQAARRPCAQGHRGAGGGLRARVVAGRRGAHRASAQARRASSGRSSAGKPSSMPCGRPGGECAAGRAAWSWSPASPASARRGWSPSSAAKRTRTARRSCSAPPTRTRSCPTSRSSRRCGPTWPRARRMSCDVQLGPGGGDPGPDRSRARHGQRGDVGRAATTTAEGERSALFDAVGSLLARDRGARPAILVLDDLHWADGASLQLLRHVARSVTDVPLLILGTYRATELGPERSVVGCARRAARSARARRRYRWAGSIRARSPR